MRAILALAAVTILIGIGGVWSLWAAASEYNSTLRTYTELDVSYQPGSFVWLTPDYNRARVTVVFENRSPADVTIENVDLVLRFDGEFAGSNYERFPPLPVPQGESRTTDLELEVTANSIQSQGGTANLGLTGSVTAKFEGIERELVLNVRATIGQVAGVE